MWALVDEAKGGLRAERAAYDECQHAEGVVGPRQELQASRSIRTRRNQPQVEPREVAQEKCPEQKPPQPTVPQKQEHRQGNDEAPERGEVIAERMALRQREGVQTGHANPGRGFKCDSTGPEYSEGHDDKSRDHGLAPAGEARNRLLERRIIRLPNETVAYELQPRLGQPRPDVALRDDQDRNCHEKTDVGREVQDKGFSWRGPKRFSLQQRQHAHRNPSDEQQTDDAWPGG
jgi:hypothetical protein